jgi:hypothetical protein
LRFQVLAVFVSGCVFYAAIQPMIAHAAYAVFDSNAFRKLIDQINQMKKEFEVHEETLDTAKDQLSVFQEVKDLADDQLAAVGAFGQISIPGFELGDFGNALEEARRCLIPDFDRLMPEFDFKGGGLSLCDRNRGYQEALFLSTDSHEGKQPFEIQEAQEEVRDRREKITADAVFSGLSLADLAVEEMNELDDVAREVENNSKNAANQRTQLAAIGQGQAGIIRALKQQTQILAQSLKIQASMALALGVPLSTDLTNDPDSREAESEEERGSDG